MWLSVYRRMADHLPNLDSHALQPNAPMAQRGVEKRRHLLAYLRKHPEELRPTVRVREST